MLNYSVAELRKTKRYEKDFTNNGCDDGNKQCDDGTEWDN